MHAWKQRHGTGLQRLYYCFLIHYVKRTRTRGKKGLVIFFHFTREIAWYDLQQSEMTWLVSLWLARGYASWKVEVTWPRTGGHSFVSLIFIVCLSPLSLIHSLTYSRSLSSIVRSLILSLSTYSLNQTLIHKLFFHFSLTDSLSFSITFPRFLFPANPPPIYLLSISPSSFSIWPSIHLISTPRPILSNHFPRSFRSGTNPQQIWRPPLNIARVFRRLHRILIKLHRVFWPDLFYRTLHPAARNYSGHFQHIIYTLHANFSTKSRRKK